MRIAIFIWPLLSIPTFVAQADSSWDWNSRRMSARVDITGDGKPETILLKTFVGKDRTGRFSRRYYRLTINDQSIYDLPFGAADGFTLANINKRDRQKEIVVRLLHLYGSDWNGCSIYWFNGRKIHRVTTEPIMWPKFPGDGSVLHYESIGHLFPEVPHYLQRDHTLRRTKRKYFRVDVDATVKEPFLIYSRPALKRVAMLRVGTKVRILKSDLGNWLYLRAGRRTYGWMNIAWNSQYTAFGWVAAG